MLQQCNGSQRDHVHGGFVTGLHHDCTSDGRGFTVESAGRDIVRGEAADQVIGGVVLLAVDQFAYIVCGERAREHGHFFGLRCGWQCNGDIRAEARGHRSSSG